MNAKQASQLLLHTVVMENDDPEKLGTVIGILEGAVWIRWANGKHGPIEFQDMENISPYNPEPERGAK